MHMHLGIVAPTAGEASLLLDTLSPHSRETIQGKVYFTSSRKGGPRATLCVCGIGKANAAHGTTLLIERFRPEFIYMLGIGGAYPSAGLSLGDVVIAEREIYGDEGLDSLLGFVSMKGLGLPLLSEGSLQCFNEIPLADAPQLAGHARKGGFVTVSSCTGTLRKGLEMEQRFPGILCENMEGAAFAHVCALNRVPAAEVRSISNIVEDRPSRGLDKDAVALACSRVQSRFIERVLSGPWR